MRSDTAPPSQGPSAASRLCLPRRRAGGVALLHFELLGREHPDGFRQKAARWPVTKIRKNKGKFGPTENHLRIFHVCPGGWGYFPRPPLTEIEDRRACDSDRRVTVNNIQVILVCGRPGRVSRCPGQGTKCRPGARYSEIRIRSRSFLRKGIELSNTVSYSLELLVWCFQKELNYLFGVSEKVTCFCATDNEFPQEFRTVRFNLEPKRCKSVSLSAKRSVSSLVGLAHGVTEKLRFPYKKCGCLAEETYAYDE